MNRCPALCVFVMNLLLSLFLVAESSGPTYVSEPVVPVLTPAVMDLPQYSEIPTEFSPEAKRRDDHGFISPDVQGDTWLLDENPLVRLQRNAPPPSPAEMKVFSTPVQNFAGYTSSSSPPDDTGDVGLNHFVQGTNSGSTSLFHVYSKTGTLLGSWAMEDLGTGSCANGYCDPIILYDQMADRWVITEFDATIRHLCVLVSVTPDPTGSYYAYDFNMGSAQDYPKYAIWHDGYYVAANNGGTIHVLEREEMLLGNPASYQSFSVGTLSGFGFQLTMPASAEGLTPPPSDEPAIYLRPCDGNLHTNCSSDVMEMWELDVDWNTPANSRLSKLANVGLSQWDHTLCGTGGIWNCMPQKGTTQKIDPIREPIHFPLQYRKFNTHETLVGCFAEDANSNDQAAVHWFEIRRDSGGWYLNQDGVIGGGDSHHRSVCSAAMDQSGNIAVGYTRTSSTVYPSIYYSGRLSSDPPGTMPYFDNVIINASSSKTNNERWGDYCGIGVDPEDDCTFWYTTEYGGSGQTRIAAFRFDACGCIEFPPQPVIDVTAVQPYQIDVSWDDSTLETITEYKLYRSTTSGGPYSLIDTIADSSPGVGGSGSYFYSDLPLPTGDTYYYVLTATDGLACISERSEEKSATLVGTRVVFDSYGVFTELTGNGNGQMEQGEKWSVDITLRNDGNLNATGVTAVLQADGVSVCNPTGYFHNLDQGGGDLETYTYRFVIDPDYSSIYGCPSDVLFDIVTKDSNELTPAGDDEPELFSGLVAGGWQDAADEAGQTGTLYSDTTNYLYSANLPVTSMPVILDECTVDISMLPPGYFNHSLVVAVEQDPDEDNVYEKQQVIFSGLVMSWSNVTGFSLSSMVDGTNTGNGKWRIRVTGTGSGTTGNMYSWTVHMSSGVWDCSYTGTGECSGCTVNVDVTPDGLSQACAGEDVAFSVSIYGGEGPFSYQWTEDGVDIPGATDASLVVSHETPQSHDYNCLVSDGGLCSDIPDSVPSSGEWVPCAAAPPPVADGQTGNGVRLSKVTNNILHVEFDVSTCSADHAIVLYGNLDNFSQYAGAVEAGCNVGSTGSGDFFVGGSDIWFNLLWTNTDLEGGHPGFSSSGSRPLNAAGFCGVSDDWHADSTCD